MSQKVRFIVPECVDHRLSPRFLTGFRLREKLVGRSK